LSHEEKESKDITYIGNDLGLKKTGITFWNNKNKEIDDNQDIFDDINSKNFRYNLDELRPCYTPYNRIFWI